MASLRRGAIGLNKGLPLTVGQMIHKFNKHHRSDLENHRVFIPGHISKFQWHGWKNVYLTRPDFVQWIYGISWPYAEYPIPIFMRENRILVCEDCDYDTMLKRPVGIAYRNQVPTGWHRLCCDGSYDYVGNLATSACVLYDTNDSLKDFDARVYPAGSPYEEGGIYTAQSPYESELIAIYLGLLLALRWDVECLFVEGDCLDVIKVLQKKVRPPMDYLDIYNEIFKLMSKFKCCDVRPIYREANQVADLLAKSIRSGKKLNNMVEILKKSIDDNRAAFPYQIFRQDHLKCPLFHGNSGGHGQPGTATVTGETPLLHAARQGHTDTAKYLLEHGANPAIPSELGAAALHHSAGIGNIELLRYLLSKGVEVDSQSDAGTPLIWAAGHVQLDAVKVLLEHHANPNAETVDGITPLSSAVVAGSLACIDLLVQAGANVNVTAGGATLLHIAAGNRSPEIINCLLKAGADPNAIDEDGQKPIQVAAVRGNRGAVEILFPLTSKVHTIPDWTVDGVLEYMQSETSKQQEQTSNLKDVNVPNDTLPKKDLPEVAPEAKKKAAEAKSRGDEAFKTEDYCMAVDAYTQAIDLDPTDATLLSNRSLCWICLGQAERALADGKACRELRPNWSKACYREGAALRLLQRFDEAANSFNEGVKLDPENKELVTAFREAVEAGRKFHGTEEEKS